MTHAKYSIGIDLGTTNCAMAFEALDSDASHSEVFLIPQWETPHTILRGSDFAFLSFTCRTNTNRSWDKVRGRKNGFQAVSRENR